MLGLVSNVPWTTVEFPVTPGQHTFRWAYSKDDSVDYGYDAAMISVRLFSDIIP